MLLLATNLALISIPYFSHRGKKGKKEPRFFIIDKLKFNQEQISDFDTSVKKHQVKVQDASKEIRSLKTELYQSLAESTPSLPSDSIVRLINAQQKIIEEAHFTHFKEIKAFCKPEQLPQFNELIKDLSKMFVHPPMKKRKNAPKKDNN